MSDTDSDTTATSTVVTKAMATVKAVEDSDHPSGEFDLILSAPTEDRDGETVDAKAFGTLPDHMSMDIDHAMSVEKTVGSGVPSYDPDGSLRVRGTYASTPLGQTVRTLVTEGHIRTASVAFIRKSTRKVDGKVHITGAELLNGAFTPVPSNRESVILSSKALAAVDEVQAKGRVTKGELLQTAHDSLVSAGATCTPDVSAAKSWRKSDDVKSIVGSIEALQDRVRDALIAAYAGGSDYFGWIRGVIPSDSGGTVIFDSSRVTSTTGWRSQTYSQDFTDDGAMVTLTGDAVVVDIHEVVAPDADADRTKSAAPVAGDPADDAQAVEDRGRALGMHAAAYS